MEKDGRWEESIFIGSFSIMVSRKVSKVERRSCCFHLSCLRPACEFECSHFYLHVLQQNCWLFGVAYFSVLNFVSYIIIEYNVVIQSLVIIIMSYNY